MIVVGTAPFNEGEKMEVKEELPITGGYLLVNNTIWFKSECKVETQPQHFGFPNSIVEQVNHSIAARPEMIYNYYR